MKKYRVLKDTHSVKAGTILVWDFGNEGYFPEGDSETFFLRKEVEKNPEWFEDITIPWVWSDELVREFVTYSISYLITENGSDLKKDWFMEKFKATKNEEKV